MEGLRILITGGCLYLFHPCLRRIRYPNPYPHADPYGDSFIHRHTNGYT